VSKTRAYYIEYPDKEMAVVLAFEGDEPDIRTINHLHPEVHIASLMIDGYETLAYTSAPVQTIDEHGPTRTWERIDPADLEEVTLYVEGSDGVMHAEKSQVRDGKVTQDWRHTYVPVGPPSEEAPALPSA
jgi:hypothetical protein